MQHPNDLQAPLFSTEPDRATAIRDDWVPDAKVVLFHGDRLDLLRSMPDGSARLLVTSPPCNIGKVYEERSSTADYVAGQTETIQECFRILADDGSICWQVGNHVENGEIVPLDVLLYPLFDELGLKLRNRIIWTFEHGLHCSNRFSGRYETILWFTKSDECVFNLDEVRVPQKYPGKKYYKGPKVGQYSSNPLGKNPGDVWVVPNVKHNHPEKTTHPCQFPVELIERLVLALTNVEDLIVDPYMGTGTTACAALLHDRRAAGAEVERQYIELARNRVMQAVDGTLPRRPMNRAVYIPPPNSSLTRTPGESKKSSR